MSNMGREPIQVVEIDLPHCTLRYGVGDCTAALGVTGDNKCFNCRATCQDLDNINEETLTLRVSPNQAGLPKDEIIFPCMAQPVATAPTKINLGGASGRSGPMGTRERVQIPMVDFLDSDVFFDNYHAERISGAAQTGAGYIPMDYGTFFGRFRARYPYYFGAELRVRNGYAGDALVDLRTDYYVVSEWEGPNHSGSVNVTAKDVFDLAEREKAQAPKQSSGELKGRIADTSGQAFTLLPSGIGSEYATSGRARIGSEIASFSRSGDTVTLIDRGLDGTTAEYHDGGSLFQQCFFVTKGNIADVVYDLLVNYAGVKPSKIPLAAWQAEATRWLSGFPITATIPNPENVLKLIGELSQLGVVFWWDKSAGLIQMRANRPLDIGEEAPEFNEDANIIEGTLRIKDLYRERLTSATIWHSVIDYSQGVSDPSNFRRAHSDRVNLDPNGQPKNMEIFSRWLGGGNDIAALTAATRLLARYRETPVEFSFAADIKDVDIAKTSSLATISTRLNQDATGRIDAAQIQITSDAESNSGGKIAVTGQTSRFTDRFGFITEDGRPDYSASTDAQRELGTYLVDGNTLLFPDGSGPYVLF